MNDKVLFVTRGGEECDEGFSYVLELAKTLGAGIEVLIIYPSRMTNNFEDIMLAATYAEAGDFKTVNTIVDDEREKFRELVARKISARTLIGRPDEPGVDLVCHSADGDLSVTIKNHLKNRPYIDMVLLSPSLSENKKAFDIRKLLKNISKPIVNISRPATARI